MWYVVMFFVVLIVGFLLNNADAIYQIYRNEKYYKYFSEAQHFNGRGL